MSLPLFIIVMETISEAVRREVPWDMLYADDLNDAQDSAANLQTRFSGWQKVLESKDLRINAGKTESMVYSKMDEPLIITDCRSNILKHVETFKYLGSYVNAKGGCEDDVKHRITCQLHGSNGRIWQEWFMIGRCQSGLR